MDGVVEDVSDPRSSKFDFVVTSPVFGIDSWCKYDSTGVGGEEEDSADGGGGGEQVVEARTSGGMGA